MDADIETKNLPRYIFEKWDEVLGTQEITREHLAAVRDRRCEFLIDLKNGTYYNADDNEWVEIKGGEI